MSTASPSYALSLTDVRKRFGSHTAVDGLSFRVKSGDIFALIGPNGAGKTTTFSILAGYLKATSGQVDILGHTPSAIGDALRGRVGVLPQDALLPAVDTVGEFLVYMASLQGIAAASREDVARAALGEVEGHDWWKKACGSLSHGMAKRVGIAQAFLGKPNLVLLDEPTAGLDPKVAYQVRQVIRKRKGTCTVVVSSHNLSEIEAICDSAAIIDRGRLVADGTMADLTAATEEIRVELAPGPTPIDALRGLNLVRQVTADDTGRVLSIAFDRASTDAETVIAAVLDVLLREKARISGVSKGRGLERRVMDLTE
jgi:ABC-type multidrug transport system ATPase subunit